jgi:hypothetical protein
MPSQCSHWELKNALLGFTQLNNAHNGKQLGQALHKIIEQVGVRTVLVPVTNWVRHPAD